MKKIYTLLFLIASFTSFAQTQEEQSIQYYSPSSINMEAFGEDTLNNLVKHIGKDSLLKIIEEKIKLSTEYLKYNNTEIESSINAYTLMAINKHFKLKLDSFLVFNPEKYDLTKSFYSLYNRRFGDTIIDNEGMQIIKKGWTKELSDHILKTSIYQEGGRIGLAIFGREIEIPYLILDTLFSASKTFDYHFKNQFFYTVIEVNKSKKSLLNYDSYVDKFHEYLFPISNLEKLMSDTTKLSTLNYMNYSLLDRIEFMALSLYAGKNYVEEYPKEVILLLSAHNAADGGFREFNLERQKTEADPTVFGLWALLQIREQLKNYY